MSAVTNFGRPMATTRISAPRVTAARSFVRLCATVTVAFSSISSLATGRPTMLLRPSTTHSFPWMEMPERFSNWMTPAGVQDT